MDLHMRLGLLDLQQGEKMSDARREWKLYKYMVDLPEFGQTSLISALPQDLFESQINEVFDQRHYKKGRVKKDMVIIDIGGNMGLTALYFKDWAKMIYALEPSTVHYKTLVKNTEGLKNVKTFNFGISSIGGPDKIFSNDQGDIPESLFGNGQLSETQNFQTLEVFMKEQKIDHVDLLKIDAEGAEYFIFPSDGFKNVASKIDNIIGEAHYFSHCMPEHVILMLEEAGYKAKILPFPNMWKDITFTEKATREQRHYKIELKTMFFASR